MRKGDISNIDNIGTEAGWQRLWVCEVLVELERRQIQRGDIRSDLDMMIIHQFGFHSTSDWVDHVPLDRRAKVGDQCIKIVNFQSREDGEALDVRRRLRQVE